MAERKYRRQLRIRSMTLAPARPIRSPPFLEHEHIVLHHQSSINNKQKRRKSENNKNQPQNIEKTYWSIGNFDDSLSIADRAIVGDEAERIGDAVGERAGGDRERVARVLHFASRQRRTNAPRRVQRSTAHRARIADERERLLAADRTTSRRRACRIDRHVRHLVERNDHRRLCRAARQRARRRHDKRVRVGQQLVRGNRQQCTVLRRTAFSPALIIVVIIESIIIVVIIESKKQKTKNKERCRILHTLRLTSLRA